MNILSKTLNNIQHQASLPKSLEIIFRLVVHFITHIYFIQNIHRHFPNIQKQSFYKFQKHVSSEKPFWLNRNVKMFEKIVNVYSKRC